MKRPLSRSQIVCIILLWVALCYIVLVYAERIEAVLAAEENAPDAPPTI